MCTAVASARLVWDGDFMQILNDEDVRAAPASAVVAAREALLQAGRRELVAPPRGRIELGSVDYVFTAGALADGTSFRAYRAGQPAGDQLVAVWDALSCLTGVVVGDELGARRTGALGAVAVDALARTDAHTLGLVAPVGRPGRSCGLLPLSAT